MKLPRISRRALLYSAGSGAIFMVGSTLYGTLFLPPSLAEPEQRPQLPILPEAGSDDPLFVGVYASRTLRTGLQEFYGYNSNSPGPTIRLRKGEHFQKSIENRLSEETTVHWHGLMAPPEMDGHPANSIGQNESFEVNFPIRQRASLNWYHPHPHENVASQVWLGLAGLFVVEDEEERALDLPSGDRELLLIVRDAQLDDNGGLTYRRNASGRQGDFPLVNGVPWPRTELTNGWNRLRILNGANARVFRLTSRAPMLVIGNDGGLLDRGYSVENIDVSPGERVDVLLDLRGYSSGEQVDLTCDRSGWNLLAIDVRGSNVVRWEPPAHLSYIAPLLHEGPPDRVFRFENNRRINDREYDMELTDFVVPFGKTERWRFESHGGAPHPIHVHGAHFQVQSRDGGRGKVMAWERGLKDTILLEHDEAVEVLIRFDHHEGRYLLHCHKLEHEDHGMMMNFVVSRDPEAAEARMNAERLFGPICSSPGISA